MHFRNFATIGLLAGAVALGTGNASAQTILKGDTTGVGGVNHTLFKVLTGILKTEAGINMQVNEGQTLTRSALKLGAGRIDIMPAPPTVMQYMQTGTRMYRKNKEAALSASKNIRLINAFVGGFWHLMVYDDSPIKTLADIKGKKIFVGPPVGGAVVTALQMIKSFSNLTPKEFEAVKLPWNAGLQAMLDGKLDMFMRPAGMGAATIDQIGAKRPFRLIPLVSLPGAPGWQQFLKGLGRTESKIPAGTYKNQTNNGNDVVANALTSQLVVRADLDADIVYRITKTMFENLEKMQKAAVTLKSISRDDVFSGANVRLHPGAIRYYKEIGKKIPERLLPKQS